MKQLKCTGVQWLYMRIRLWGDKRSTI